MATNEQALWLLLAVLTYFSLMDSITDCYTSFVRTPVLPAEYTTRRGGAPPAFAAGIKKVSFLSEKQRLTPEQNDIRLRGLRILARMIARAHLDAVAEAAVVAHGDGADGSDGPGQKDDPHKEGEYVG